MVSIIILGAGIMQIPVIKTAKQMGLNVIAVDKNPDAPGFKYADVKLPYTIKWRTASLIKGGIKSIIAVAMKGV